MRTKTRQNEIPTEQNPNRTKSHHNENPSERITTRTNIQNIAHYCDSSVKVYKVYADIRGGSPGRGCQMTVGLSTTAIFGDFGGNFFGNVRDKASGGLPIRQSIGSCLRPDTVGRPVRPQRLIFQTLFQSL